MSGMFTNPDAGPFKRATHVQVPLVSYHDANEILNKKK